MSVDPFANAIATELNALGYNCVLCTQPTYRDYSGDLPIVFITPLRRNIVNWLVFQTINVLGVYQLVYILPPNYLDTNLGDNYVYQFKQDVIHYFMGGNANLKAEGAWNCTVTDIQEYNQGLLKEGYTYSSVAVNVFYIDN